MEKARIIEVDRFWNSRNTGEWGHPSYLVVKQGKNMISGKYGCKEVTPEEMEKWYGNLVTMEIDYEETYGYSPREKER